MSIGCLVELRYVPAYAYPLHSQQPTGS
jgi:hypothetical protein